MVRLRYPTRVREVRPSVRHLVRLIGNTDGSYEKREAQRCVEEWLLSENGSVEALADSLAHVYDGEQPANGPRDLRLTPLLVARQIQGRVLGLKALSAGRTFSDQWWWWARHAHLHSAADFFAHRGQYERETAGTEAARLYSLENVVQVCSSACLFLDRYVQATTLLPLQEQRSPHALAGLALH